MSLRSFAALALSSRKREDLGLFPVRIHSLPRSYSPTFHVDAHDLALTLCAGRQQRGRQPSMVHPLPAGQRRVGDATDRRLRRAGCESDASLSRHLQADVSVECHLSRIRPCLTRSLARCFSCALRHGAALLRTLCALRVSAFRKSFRQIPAQNVDEKISRTFRKSAAWPWERGTSRRFAQECPE